MWMYWLFKEDPQCSTFDDLVKEGKTRWDGVHNNLALIHLRNVKKGDLIFFYHTGEEKQIVGVMKAINDAFSTDKKAELHKSKEVAVDVAPVKRLKRPVSLEQIKKNPILKDVMLLRIPRLSVMPLEGSQWDELMKLGS